MTAPDDFYRDNSYDGLNEHEVDEYAEQDLARLVTRAQEVWAKKEVTEEIKEGVFKIRIGKPSASAKSVSEEYDGAG